MENTSFLLIDESVLPEVYQKVIRVNQLLETGEASNTSEAVKMAGISRSVYYKYKNAVFPYNEFIMITVDGREHASIGMTLGETARLMKEFGCVEAMNLDGGGSTVMYVSGKVVNKPAQAGGIPISNALTISEKIQVAAGDLPQNN